MLGIYYISPKAFSLRGVVYIHSLNSIGVQYPPLYDIVNSCYNEAWNDVMGDKLHMHNHVQPLLYSILFVY